MINLLRSIAVAILSGRKQEMEDWLDWLENNR